jgi:GTP-binding protein Era
MSTTSSTYCGTVVLAGAPNVGKSTLLNAIVGSRLAIVSPRPQSTRSAVVGIHTSGSRQLIVLDPPGLLEPRYLLQEAMLGEALDAVRNADIVLSLRRGLDPSPPLDALVPEDLLAGKLRATVVTAADLLTPEALGDLDPDAFVVSARTGAGVPALTRWCLDRLPEGPHRYPDDDLSTQPVRFFVEELLREAVFANLDKELPYAVAAKVEEFRESERPVYVGVTLFVERESQKGIVIGKRGAMIKAIGAAARAEIEALLDHQVYLDLRVKVLPRWRKSPSFLRQLGFRVPTER